MIRTILECVVAKLDEIIALLTKAEEHIPEVPSETRPHLYKEVRCYVEHGSCSDSWDFYYCKYYFDAQTSDEDIVKELARIGFYNHTVKYIKIKAFRKPKAIFDIYKEFDRRLLDR